MHAMMLFGSWHGKYGLSVGSHVSPALLDLKPSLEGFQGQETTELQTRCVERAKILFCKV